MNAFCYILFSQKLNVFYTGASQDDIEGRIHKHNTGYYGNDKFTAKTDDWVLFILLEADDFAHAVRIERKIKAMKSAKYIRNLLKYPEMVLKIINKTK